MISNAGLYAAQGDQLNAGLSAAGAVPFLGWAATAGKVGNKAIWTAKKGMSSVENAFDHWIRHGKEFPNIQNSKQYVEKAKEFLSNPPKGAWQHKRVDGDISIYDPITNIFGVRSSEGIPRTFFKPKDGPNYWLKGKGN